MTNQKLTSCEKSSSSFLPLAWFGRLFSLVQSSQLGQQIAHVHRGIHAIRLARTNFRYYVAAFFIAVLAPLSEFGHHFFDINSGTGYWNAYYFLRDIGPHVALLLSLSGAFIAYPKAHKFKFIFIVPSVYAIARIIWVSSVSDNAGYNAFTPIGLLVYGAALASVATIVMEFLIWLHFHWVEGHRARVDGAILSPGLDDSTARSIAREQIKLSRNIA